MTPALITTAEAAARLGYTPERLRVLIRKGRIKGVSKFGRDYALDPDELAVIPGKPGRPAHPAASPDPEPEPGD